MDLDEYLVPERNVLFRCSLTAKVTADALVKKVKSWTWHDAAMIVREVGLNNGPHLHVWCHIKGTEDDSSKKARDAVSDALTYAYKGEGKSKYRREKPSTKPNLMYMCKGPSKEVQTDPDVLLNTMWSDEKVAEAHRQYWAGVRSKPADRDETAGKKEKPSNFQAALTYVDENYDRLHDVMQDEVGHDLMEEQCVMVCLMEYYRTRTRCQPNDFQLKAMTNSIMNHRQFKVSTKQGMRHLYYRACSILS